MYVAVNHSRRDGGEDQLKASYLRAIRYLGHLPLPIHSDEPDHRIIRKLQISTGVIFIGGPDIPPEFYGGRCHPSIQQQAQQKIDHDFRILHYALKIPKPVLGICAGMQTIGCYFGGSLLPHIPETGTGINHQSTSGRHRIRVSHWMAKQMKNQTPVVNSRHHQCVGTPGPVLRVAGLSPDGIIEAVRHPSLPVVGVQWHPEDLLQDPEILRAFLRGWK